MKQQNPEFQPALTTQSTARHLLTGTGAFSCHARIKTSALDVSNWLSALKKNPILVLLLDRIIPWVGEISYLLGCTTSCGHPLFVPIILPTQMAGKRFVSAPAWTASMKTLLKQKKKSGFSQDWSMGVPQFLITALSVELSHFLEWSRSS